MAVLREAMPFADSPALADSTAAVASSEGEVASTGEAVTAAEATDSLNEVMENMKHEMMKITTIPLAFVAMWASAAFPSLAQQPAQPTFPSAVPANPSLFEA